MEPALNMGHFYAEFLVILIGLRGASLFYAEFLVFLIGLRELHPLFLLFFVAFCLELGY